MPSRHPLRYVDHRVGERRLQRTAAILSLVAGVVGVVALTWFAAGHLVALVALPLTALALLFLGFTALTSTGVHQLVAGVLAAVVAVGLLVVAVVRIAAHDGVAWSGLAGLAALAAAAVLGRYALRVPTPRGETIWAAPRQGPTARRGVVLANPGSGGGKVEQCGLVEVGRRAGIDVVVMAPGDDLRRLAERAVADGADVLGMAGGDGSLGVVAQVCVEHDLPFVCVPAGTRNHFALDLGLDRGDPTLALAAFVNGDEHRIDYGTVNGRLFLNNVSLGAYAAAVEHPGYREAKAETTLGLLPELVAQGGPWFDLQFDVPGDGRWESAALVQVSNGVYEMAGANFGRRLHLDAGELGVVAVDVAHAGELVALTVLAAARHPERAAGVWPWSTEHFRVASTQAELGVGIDGEHVRVETPLEFRIVGQGLRVLVPTGTPVGLAAQHLGAQGMVSGLLEVAFDLGGDGAAGGPDPTDPDATVLEPVEDDGRVGR